MHGLVLLLDGLDVGEGIAEDLGFLEGCCSASGGLVHACWGDGFLQSEKLGVHVCAVALLDDVVGSSFRGIACLWVLAGGGLVGFLG